MYLKDFDYYLPPEKIAQTPLKDRDSSKLLVLDRISGIAEDKNFYDICEYLNDGDLLVFNNTKVIPARLIGKKETGARIEVFLLHCINETDWEVLVKPGKRALIGSKIEFSQDLACEIVSNTDFGGRVARFSFTGNFRDRISEIGEVPLPPYIHEKIDNMDRYQTVYAKEEGSVAAPTAGLHFTPKLLDKIKSQGVNTAFVTLHVGLGTFRPVSAENILDHVMHEEYFSVNKETADLITSTKKSGKRIIAVGTTSVRVLESVMTEDGVMNATIGKTGIFIYPGYKFKAVDALITNFHLPQSTLLMLVSALANRELILKTYKKAIENDYRFFSFGDAMLIK